MLFQSGNGGEFLITNMTFQLLFQQVLQPLMVPLRDTPLLPQLLLHFLKVTEKLGGK